jgi:hypothetical protein
MRTPEEIRAERGYRRIDLTIAERDFLRGLVMNAKASGNELATDRLLRALDTTFEKFRRSEAA